MSDLEAAMGNLLVKYAERYSWIRNNIEKYGEEIECVDEESADGYFARYRTPAELDAAIDAQIEEGKK